MKPSIFNEGDQRSALRWLETDVPKLIQIIRLVRKEQKEKPEEWTQPELDALAGVEAAFRKIQLNLAGNRDYESCRYLLLCANLLLRDDGSLMAMRWNERTVPAFRLKAVYVCLNIMLREEKWDKVDYISEDGLMPAEEIEKIGCKDRW